MKNCPAIFATYLGKQRIELESEVIDIDISRGKVPTSVFAAHYLKTDIQDDRIRILKAVGNF